MPITINGSGTITGLSAGGLPDGTVQPADLTTGAPSWDSSGNLSFNSGYGSATTAYGCRAWVNFNGTGTVAIRASGNVSSITDNGTGDYTVNFTNAMPDANYSIGGMVKYPDTSGGTTQTTIMIARVASPLTTSSARFLTGQSNATAYDCDPVCVSIFR